MQEQKTYEVSIFWKNDSDELLRMLNVLGDPGEVAGNDGCQIIVTESEMEDIREYAQEHPQEIYLEESGEIKVEEARQKINQWRTA